MQQTKVRIADFSLHFLLPKTKKETNNKNKKGNRKHVILDRM